MESPLGRALVSYQKRQSLSFRFRAGGGRIQRQKSAATGADYPAATWPYRPGRQWLLTMIASGKIGTNAMNLQKAQLKAAGVAPDLMRLSIGLEDADDILDDLAQALETASK